MQQAGYGDVLVNRLPIDSDTPPISAESDRCRGDASASRGNQTSGTETTRPSVSVTESASVEHDTSTASTSVFSVKVLIPSLQEELRILNNQLSNIGHLLRSKTPHVGDPDRSKPKLRIPSGMGDMDVRRLAPLHAKEEEPIPLTLRRVGASQVYPAGQANNSGAQADLSFGWRPEMCRQASLMMQARSGEAGWALSVFCRRESQADRAADGRKVARAVTTHLTRLPTRARFAGALLLQCPGEQSLDDSLSADIEPGRLLIEAP